MRVFIQAKNGTPTDQDHFNAYIGFREMGFETVFFETFEELAESKMDDVVVGYIGTVAARLRDFNREIEDMDYPEVLRKYLKRRLWKSTANTVNSNPEMWPVFMKPIHNKKFKGRIIREPADLIGCGSYYEDYPVYCSEVKEIIAEFRVFVLYGEIIDVRRYGGRWDVACDADVVESCVKDSEGAPKAYALDFGVTKDGETILVEVNNTCSIGSYGLEPVLYARFLSARWAELTGTTDECRF